MTEFARYFLFFDSNVGTPVAEIIILMIFIALVQGIVEMSGR